MKRQLQSVVLAGACLFLVTAQADEWDDDSGLGGSGDELAPLPPSAQSSQAPPSTLQPVTTRRSGIPERLSVMLGGGVEGYSSGALRGGPTWGVTVGTQPTRWLGAEVSYTGSANEANRSVTAAPQGLSSGADLVRNGGQVAASLNLPTPLIQPYVLAGLGLDFYNARGPGGALDTAGRVPLGGGLRARAGPFTADLRGEYDVLFANDLPVVTRNGGGTSAYRAVLQMGGRF